MTQNFSEYNQHYLNVPREELTVRAAFLRLLRHPHHLLLRRWNWKTALLSCLIRGALFFTVNATASVMAATEAMLREVSFLVITAGFYGAIVQAFRRARPAWAASLIVMLLLPSVNHTLELIIHSAGGTKKLTTSLIASICFSALSACFNLFAMRRGVLIVGRNRQSLIADIRQMPGIVLAFLLVLPKKIFMPESSLSERIAEASRNSTEEAQSLNGD